MGAITAQILIGKSHAYDSGIINITHSLFLSENGTAVWKLKREESQLLEDASHGLQEIQWIPNPDSIFEDGLLMIGLFVCRDQELLNLANQVFKKPLNEFQSINDDMVGIDDLKKLHKLCRLRMRSDFKLVITILNGSSIKKELPVIADYPMEVDVATVKYSRSLSVWERTMKEWGSLSNE